VARRRRLREEATAEIGSSRPGGTAVSVEEAIKSAKAELARLEKVAEEIARRRTEREKAKPTGERK
jgi:hypothetical protein